MAHYDFQCFSWQSAAKGPDFLERTTFSKKELQIGNVIVSLR